MEVIQYSNLSSYNRQLSSIMLECSVNPNLGDSEMIWNSSASYLSHYTTKHRLYTRKHRLQHLKQLLQLLKHRRNPVYSVDRLRKGWNKEWGSLQLPCSRARIGKLLDRDYVWAVTQTMVSFGNLALWAVHTLRYYKVYPGFWGRTGFWGRRLLSFKSLH